MKITVQYIAALAFITVATPSLAQPNFDQFAARMMEADANGDNQISREEMSVWRKTQWAKMDRDHDGYFSKEDLPRFARAKWDNGRPLEMRKIYDHNHDGRISRAEFINSPMAMFDRADSNNDNVVTRSEIELAAATIKSLRQGR
ncbi:MAG: EF-hand domain-containing protein [Parasphingorhabdus sp.]|uniref:EF-hand domain-containing protein n=1 Tax=Parasphingorhabdus sp. TaxID=2709688 RepID=UPI00300139F2